MVHAHFGVYGDFENKVTAKDSDSARQICRLSRTWKIATGAQFASSNNGNVGVLRGGETKTSLRLNPSSGSSSCSPCLAKIFSAISAVKSGNGCPISLPFSKINHRVGDLRIATDSVGALLKSKSPGWSASHRRQTRCWSRDGSFCRCEHET